MTSYIIKADGLPHITKDPDATINYSWDWNRWLTKAGSAGVDSAVIDADDGLTLVGQWSIADGIVTQVISGGEVGQSYKVVCRITTVDPIPLTDDQTIVIDVRQR